MHMNHVGLLRMWDHSAAHMLYVQGVRVNTLSGLTRQQILAKVVDESAMAPDLVVSMPTASTILETVCLYPWLLVQSFHTSMNQPPALSLLRRPADTVISTP